MKNKYRIIFWGFILLICLSCGITGIINNNTIFKGQSDKFNKIIENFNNSTLLRDYKTREINIKARLKGKNIVVNYEGMQSKTFKFINKEKYLEVKYSKDDNFGYIIVMLMTDSISEYYNQQDEIVYPLFNNQEVMNYTLKDGIEITTKDNDYIVKINLDTPLLLPTIENNTNEEIVPEEVNEEISNENNEENENTLEE